jgi:hypothetical protein
VEEVEERGQEEEEQHQHTTAMVEVEAERAGHRAIAEEVNVRVEELVHHRWREKETQRRAAHCWTVLPKRFQMLNA